MLVAFPRMYGKVTGAPIIHDPDQCQRSSRQTMQHGKAASAAFHPRNGWHCHGYYERAADRWHRICHFGSGAISAASEERDMVEATLGNARFFRRSGPYSLAVVASTARGVADELELLLEGVAPLQTAGPNEVSFLDNRRYASALDQTSAGAVIVHPDMAARVPAGTVAILTTEPYAAGRALLHCSIPCHQFLPVSTRPQLSRRGRASIRLRRSGRCL